tara:strand:- start:972 stop:1241 length:270 start_codon:yes stop_codon:yes gene_type:complete
MSLSEEYIAMAAAENKLFKKSLGGRSSNYGFKPDNGWHNGNRGRPKHEKSIQLRALAELGASKTEIAFKLDMTVKNVSRTARRHGIVFK